MAMQTKAYQLKMHFIWFVITVAALCIAGTSQAQKTIVKKDSPVKTSH